jgi:hypothetical protein
MKHKSTCSEILILAALMYWGVAEIDVCLGDDAEFLLESDARPETNSSRDASRTAKLPFDESKLRGSYRRGDYRLGTCELKLESEHRFRFTRDRGERLPEQNRGSWRIDGDTLTLSPELPVNQGDEMLNSRFLPIKWGNRLYLVKEQEMPAFCAQSGRHRTQMNRVDSLSPDYIKRYRKKNPPPLRGEPSIPERYKHFYEEGPIEAEVIDAEKKSLVVLNKGSRDRLEAEMLMVLSDGRDPELQIVFVADHTSTARALYWPFASRHVRVGDRFTTGCHNDRPAGPAFARFDKPPSTGAARRASLRGHWLRPRTGTPVFPIFADPLTVCSALADAGFTAGEWGEESEGYYSCKHVVKYPVDPTGEKTPNEIIYWLESYEVSTVRQVMLAIDIYDPSRQDAAFQRFIELVPVLFRNLGLGKLPDRLERWIPKGRRYNDTTRYGRILFIKRRHEEGVGFLLTISVALKNTKAASGDDELASERM